MARTVLGVVAQAASQQHSTGTAVPKGASDDRPPRSRSPRSGGQHAAVQRPASTAARVPAQPEQRSTASSSFAASSSSGGPSRVSLTGRGSLRPQWPELDQDQDVDSLITRRMQLQEQKFLAIRMENFEAASHLKNELERIERQLQEIAESTPDIGTSLDDYWTIAESPMQEAFQLPERWAQGDAEYDANEEVDPAVPSATLQEICNESASSKEKAVKSSVHADADVDCALAWTSEFQKNLEDKVCAALGRIGCHSHRIVQRVLNATCILSVICLWKVQQNTMNVEDCELPFKTWFEAAMGRSSSSFYKWVIRWWKRDFMQHQVSSFKTIDAFRIRSWFAAARKLHNGVYEQAIPAGWISEIMNVDTHAVESRMNTHDTESSYSALVAQIHDQKDVVERHKPVFGIGKLDSQQPERTSGQEAHKRPRTLPPEPRYQEAMQTDSTLRAAGGANRLAADRAATQKLASELSVAQHREAQKWEARLEAERVLAQHHEAQKVEAERTAMREAQISEERVAAQREAQKVEAERKRMREAQLAAERVAAQREAQKVEAERTAMREAQLAAERVAAQREAQKVEAERKAMREAQLAAERVAAQREAQKVEAERKAESARAAMRLAVKQEQAQEEKRVDARQKLAKALNMRDSNILLEALSAGMAVGLPAEDLLPATNELKRLKQKDDAEQDLRSAVPARDPAKAPIRAMPSEAMSNTKSAVEALPKVASKVKARTTAPPKRLSKAKATLKAAPKGNGAATGISTPLQATPSLPKAASETQLESKSPANADRKPQPKSRIRAVATRVRAGGRSIGAMTRGRAGSHSTGAPEETTHTQAATPQTPDTKRWKVEERYVKHLTAGTDGLAYRITKNLEDKAPFSLNAKWGTIVLGVDEGDNWLRVYSTETSSAVRNMFLPMTVLGKVVLEEMPDIASRSSAQDNMPQNVVKSRLLAPKRVHKQSTNAAACEDPELDDAPLSSISCSSAVPKANQAYVQQPKRGSSTSTSANVSAKACSHQVATASLLGPGQPMKKRKVVANSSSEEEEARVAPPSQAIKREQEQEDFERTIKEMAVEDKADEEEAMMKKRAAEEREHTIDHQDAMEMHKSVFGSPERTSGHGAHKRPRALQPAPRHQEENANKEVFRDEAAHKKDTELRTRAAHEEASTNDAALKEEAAKEEAAVNNSDTTTGAAKEEERMHQADEQPKAAVQNDADDDLVAEQSARVNAAEEERAAGGAGKAADERASEKPIGSDTAHEVRAAAENPPEEKVAAQKTAAKKTADEFNAVDKETAAAEKDAAEKAAQEKPAADRADEQKAPVENTPEEKAAEQEAAAKKAAEEFNAVDKAKADNIAAYKDAEEKAEEKAAAEKATEQIISAEKTGVDKPTAEQAAEETAAAQKATEESADRSRTLTSKAAEERAAAEKVAPENAAAGKTVGQEITAEAKAAASKAEADTAAQGTVAAENHAVGKPAVEKDIETKTSEEKAKAEKVALGKTAQYRSAAEKATADEVTSADKGDGAPHVSQPLPSAPVQPKVSAPASAPKAAAVPLASISGQKNVLVCGNINGRMDLLKEKISKWEPVPDLVLCVGNFLNPQAEPEDQQIRAFLGKDPAASLPCPTYFIDRDDFTYFCLGHQDISRSSSGKTNLGFMGAAGVDIVDNLCIAYLCGAYKEESLAEVEPLMISTHDWHNYTRRAIQDIEKRLQGMPPVDILMTSEAPDLYWSTQHQGLVPSSAVAEEHRSPIVRELLNMTKPRYHICAPIEKKAYRKAEVQIPSTSDASNIKYLCTSVMLGSAKEENLKRREKCSWSHLLQITPGESSEDALRGINGLPKLPVRQNTVPARDAVDKVATYMADNSKRRGQWDGITYRKSKDYADLARNNGKPAILRFGDKVEGIDCGDGWLRVDTYFLPMSLTGIPVLKRIEEKLASKAALLGMLVAKAPPPGAGLEARSSSAALPSAPMAKSAPASSPPASARATATVPLADAPNTPGSPDTPFAGSTSKSRPAQPRQLPKHAAHARTGSQTDVHYNLQDGRLTRRNLATGDIELLDPAIWEEL